VSSVISKIRFRDPQVEMAHGAGGKASRRLIDGLFAPILFGSTPAPLGDAAHVNINGTCVAMTTDSFVVRPLRFPGGSIGELAVNGTVNDLAVSGARARALVVSFVLEAGLPTEILEAEVRAMAAAAKTAGVTIAGGDTKVVEHGKADQMYITTSGIGNLIPGMSISPAAVRPGDKILLSGPIGDHGITILLARGELDLEADLRSDTRSVLPLVEALAEAVGPAIQHAVVWRPRLTNSRMIAVSGSHFRKIAFPFTMRCEARASYWDSTRCTSPTRDSFSLWWRQTRQKWQSRYCVVPRAGARQHGSAR
jgi:hydrogenase expression/formation protein HypE